MDAAELDRSIATAQKYNGARYRARVAAEAVASAFTSATPEQVEAARAAHAEAVEVYAECYPLAAAAFAEHGAKRMSLYDACRIAEAEGAPHDYHHGNRGDD
jgi:pyridoxine 5'-phosphate synthase PdxJ